MKFSNYQSSIRLITFILFLLTNRKYKIHEKMQEGATSRSHSTSAFQFNYCAKGALRWIKNALKICIGIKHSAFNKIHWNIFSWSFSSLLYHAIWNLCIMLKFFLCFRSNALYKHYSNYMGVCLNELERTIN